MEEYLEDDGGEIHSAAFEQDVRFNIVKYMDRSGALTGLEQAGLKYKDGLEGVCNKTNDNPPFTFTVNLDLLQIADISGELSLMVLESPLTAVRLFKDVVHCSLVTLCALPLVTIDQVQVILRVDSLPAEVGLRLTGSRRPDPTARRLLLLQGVVAALTAPTKYTCVVTLATSRAWCLVSSCVWLLCPYRRSTVFRCCNLLCPGSTGRRVWGSWTTSRRCRFCGGPSEETPRARDVGDQVLAVMMDPEALKADRAPVQHPVHVRFTGALTRGLELGCRYDVVVLTGGGRPWDVEAWGVRASRDRAQRRVDRHLRSEPLPAAIQDIWIESSADTDSPWAFAVALASQLGGGRYPAHAFLHLKLGLVLSLASQGLAHPPVPLLALGDDPAGPALFSWALRLAARGVDVAGPGPALGDTATGTLAPQQPRSAPRSASTAASPASWLSAGPLILAQGGVCLLGCWDKWKRSSSALSIKAALESGRAILETRGPTGSQLPGTGPSVPLKCAVWTYWSPGNKATDGSTLRTLLDTLGAPVLSDAGCEVEDLCEHFLSKATGKNFESPKVSREELFEFLTLVNAQPVSLNDEAIRLIQDYFVASRRVRPNCLPVTAIGTIAAMAEALARISLRVEATWADVVLVVWMYEVALTALFGPCLISPLPEGSCQPLQSRHLTKQMDCRLYDIKIWLENFTKSVLLSSLQVQDDNTWG